MSVVMTATANGSGLGGDWTDFELEMISGGGTRASGSS